MQHGRTGASVQVLVATEKGRGMRHVQVIRFAMIGYTKQIRVSTFLASLMESGQIGQVGQSAASSVGKASGNEIAHV